LTTSKVWPMTAKLADFGLSDHALDVSDKQIDEKVMTSAVGTPIYIAPEVFKHRPYSTAVDVWACGVLLYVILSGKPPFEVRTLSQLRSAVLHRDVKFPAKQWESISDDAILLIRGLMQRDPTKRLTAIAARNHRWITKAQAEKNIGNDLTELSRAVMAWRSTFTKIAAVNRLQTIAAEDGLQRK